MKYIVDNHHENHVSSNTATIVQRFWNNCDVLRDGEIEKELDGARVRAERLRGSVLKNAFEGKL